MKLWTAALLAALSSTTARKLSSSKDPIDEQAGLEASDVELQDVAQLDVEQLASVTMKPQEDSLLPATPSITTEVVEDVPVTDLSAVGTVQTGQSAVEKVQTGQSAAVKVQTGLNLSAVGKLQQTSSNKQLSKVDRKAKQKQDLLDLEADLIAFAKTAKAQPDSSLNEMVSQIQVLLNQMADEIKREFDALDHESTQAHGCYQECVDKHVGNYSCHPPNESIPIIHRRCRRTQWGMWQHYLSLLQQLAYREQIRDYWCLKWQLNETDSTWPPDTQCMYPATQYAQYGKLALSKFYADQHGYWSNYYNRIVYSREQCHLASWWYNYTFEQAQNAQNNYTAQKVICDEHQDTLNNESCKFKECYDFCPDGYMQCYWNCHGHCDSPYRETACNGNQGGNCGLYKSLSDQYEELKDFVRLVLRIKCLINALTAWDVGKAIDMCIQKTYCDNTPSFSCQGPNYDSKYDALDFNPAQAGQGPIPENETELCGMIPSPEFFPKPPEPPKFCRGGSFKKIGQGSCAGPQQVWDVGGDDAKGQGAQACYQAIMADDQCEKDYFTYNNRSDQNCGCKKVGTGALSLVDCPDADYYETVTFAHWQKYLPQTDLYQKYYYRGCFNLNITCRAKCCNQITYLDGNLETNGTSKITLDDGNQALTYSLPAGFL